MASPGPNPAVGVDIVTLLRYNQKIIINLESCSLKSRHLRIEEKPRLFKKNRLRSLQINFDISAKFARFNSLCNIGKYVARTQRLLVFLHNYMTSIEFVNSLTLNFVSKKKTIIAIGYRRCVAINLFELFCPLKVLGQVFSIKLIF